MKTEAETADQLDKEEPVRDGGLFVFEKVALFRFGLGDEHIDHESHGAEHKGCRQIFG